ncbi:MAG TPA: hypothetical protein VF133_09590 [Terriglobales bacterium]
MIIASELHEGMVLRIEGQIYKVVEIESKAGAAQMGGVVKAKLINVHSGRLWEPHFRPQERFEDLQIERRAMEFLYADGDNCTFMRPDTFEQVEIPGGVIGPAARFLHPGEELVVEFFAGQAISVVLPAIAEARVSSTAPPSRGQQDSAWKEAILENGIKLRVPLFIAPGEVVRVEVKTGRYLERAHAAHKRSA